MKRYSVELSAQKLVTCEVEVDAESEEEARELAEEEALAAGDWFDQREITEIEIDDIYVIEDDEDEDGDEEDEEDDTDGRDETETK